MFDLNELFDVVQLATRVSLINQLSSLTIPSDKKSEILGSLERIYIDLYETDTDGLYNVTLAYEDVTTLSLEDGELFSERNQLNIANVSILLAFQIIQPHLL